MIFYTRYFFKLKRPQFIPPGKIDEEFYTEIKDRMAKEPGFKFKSEISFWDTYKYILLTFLLFCLSTSVFFFRSTVEKYPLLYGISFFLFIILLQPGTYFIVLMTYLAIYLKKERKFHTDIKKGISKSHNFEEFISTFYNGEYAEYPPLKEYFFENDISQLKNLVDGNNITNEIAVYKISNNPDEFIVLSRNLEVNKLLESKIGWSEIDRNDKIRWTIKYQTEIPCVFGNKKLKSLMEL